MRMKTIFAILLCVTVSTVMIYMFVKDDKYSIANDNVNSKIYDFRHSISKEFEQNSMLIQDIKHILKYAEENKSVVIGGKQHSEPSIPRKQDHADVVALGEESFISAKEENRSDKIISPIIPVVVFACNRVTVKKCLDQLIQYRPSKEQFPIIVSQDCNHEPTRNVILSYGDELILIQQPDQSDIIVPPREKKFKGYFKIARHYGWALNETFFKFGYETAIIVEDDLDIAPDFFEYFLGTYPILKMDNTLWCVSAWNDNGKADLVDENAAELLYRTDFFPGLGWMLTRDLWSELAPKWPKSYWDDWIRQPQQRKERACIRPELSRTRTFGKYGVSNGLFFEKHLKYIKLNEKFVPFKSLNLTYLLKDNYDTMFVKEVYTRSLVSYGELRANLVTIPGPVRIPYHTKDAYKRTAKILGLMDDFRSGVPRMGYRGIVSFYYNGRRVYLAPQASWKGYDITWS